MRMTRPTPDAPEIAKSAAERRALVSADDYFQHEQTPLTGAKRPLKRGIAPMLERYGSERTISLQDLENSRRDRRCRLLWR
jgi:hypothetical protein